MNTIFGAFICIALILLKLLFLALEKQQRKNFKDPDFLFYTKIIVNVNNAHESGENQADSCFGIKRSIVFSAEYNN